MTKMKSKKMTKSAFAMIIMAIVMVAMIAFGGTYAYFTAVDNASGDFAETAKVQIGSTTTISKTADLTLAPGQSTDGPAIAFSNESTTETYVFINVTAKVGTNELFVDVSGTKVSILSVEVASTYIGTGKWTRIGTTNVYWAKVASEGTIPAFAYSVKLNENVQAKYDADSAETVKEDNNVYVGTKSQEGTWSYEEYDEAIMGQTLSLGVNVSAIQTYNYELEGDKDPDDMTTVYEASIADHVK